MTDGMKSGAGSDPFADDLTDEEESSEDPEALTEEADETVDTSSQSNAGTDSPSDQGSQSTDPEQIDEELPYLFDRYGVKDERKMVQYFLREETQDTVTNTRSAVEDELGTDVPLTDLREALVRVGAEHLDEVADELREWGYRFREE